MNNIKLPSGNMQGFVAVMLMLSLLILVLGPSITGYKAPSEAITQTVLTLAGVVATFFLRTSQSGTALLAAQQSAALVAITDGTPPPVTIAALPEALEATLPSALDATLPAALDAALAEPAPPPIAKMRAQFPPPSAP